MVPKDLHSREYAVGLAENLGIPAADANIKILAACIEAVAKWRNVRKDEAYAWLYRRAEMAQTQGIEIDTLWWINAGYKYVRIPLEDGPRIDWKAMLKEQSLPEWQEVADKLRAKLKAIAFPKALHVKNSRAELQAQAEKVAKR
jgi:hypothetical protein